ncbi:MAG: hypothetical protein PHO02_04020 [Candidatus Nanoarchaeia archaeon]|nr:hypothetical protein [Candidatus Nanoarchaeia archaeon]
MNYIYRTTNESLEGVIKGMQLSKDDNVLAILGSGDQAFAMLEYADSVVAIDSKPGQLAYAQKQKELLAEGNIQKFLTRKATIQSPTLRRRIADVKDYFNEPGRIGKIREKLGNLRIEKGDIFADLPESQFSRIYLSNVLRYVPYNEFCVDKLLLLAEKLKPNGLLYITDERDLYRESLTPLEIKMEKDDELTRIAKKEEKKIGVWAPVVYRRKA